MNQKKKHWIAGAISKQGSLSTAAKKADESTAAYADDHENDAGVVGRRARLAETLMRLQRKK